MTNFKMGLALAAALFAGTAIAHHSASMFDRDHRMTLTGTVRVFQWTNPHAYIQLIVPDKKGNPEEWSLEMAAPLYLQQRGWRPSTLKPGDTLTVIISPLRKMKDRKGGLVFAATDAAGKPIGKPMENGAVSQSIGEVPKTKP
ncbi:MAG: DUF6152 family protein [Pseudomonadota bacterium]